MLFAKKIDAETSTLTDVRNAILSELGNTTPGTTEYEVLIQQLKTVCDLQHQDKKSSAFKPSADTLLNGGLTILSILMITRHEQLNVITSKAFSFLPKLIR